MGAAADANFINERVAINQTPRERRSVQDFLLQRDDVDPDVGKARIDQGFLDRVDRVEAERHLIELRWVGRKETSDDLVQQEYRLPASSAVHVLRLGLGTGSGEIK